MEYDLVIEHYNYHLIGLDNNVAYTTQNMEGILMFLEMNGEKRPYQLKRVFVVDSLKEYERHYQQPAVR